jgi:hypothetical protein
MHHVFPHGEVPHFPSIHPAAFQALATAVDPGSSDTDVDVEHADAVVTEETPRHWSLPWVQKSLSIKRGGKHDLP